MLGLNNGFILGNIPDNNNNNNVTMSLSNREGRILHSAHAHVGMAEWALIGCYAVACHFRLE